MSNSQRQTQGSYERQTRVEDNRRLHSPDRLLIPAERKVLFIGRQEEFALLWSRYEAAASGHAGVVLVSGEPGIGKTRLLEVLAARALINGARVLKGGASVSEGMPPYLPFLESLGQYIRTADTDQLREQVAHSAATLAGIFPELAARLGQVPQAYTPSSDQTRLRLYEAIVDFLDALAAEQPLVLVLDDLHWADAASFDLLGHVLRRKPAARLLIVGAYREGGTEQNPALARAVSELTRLRVLATVPVGALSAGEIAALATSYLGRQLDPAISRLLYTQSEGNPFFVEELLQGWIETGAISDDSQHWDMLARLENRLPPGIVAAIRDRLAMLSPEVVDQLRVAAIVGRTFDAPVLAGVQDTDVEVVEERLLEARRASLIRPHRGGTFTFIHDKTRESLYAEVSSARRRRLHEAIGRVLEAQPEQESAQQLANLAFHFARSGDRDRGATYSQRAAELALRTYAFEEAHLHYRTALELLHEDDDRRGDLLLRLGETALLAGADSEAEAAYEAAYAWWLEAGDQQAVARAAHGQGLARWRRDALQAAQTSLEKALSLLEAHPGPEMVRVLVDLSDLLGMDLGAQEQALAFGRRALELARRQGDARLEAAASRTVGNLLVKDNDMAAGVTLLERALELADANDDLREAGECCFRLSQAYCRLAQLERAEEAGQRWERLAQSCHDPFQFRHLYSWLAFLYASRGDWTDAEYYASQASPVVERLASAEPSAYLMQMQGFLAYQRSDYTAAEKFLQEAVALFRSTGPSAVLAWNLELLALADLSLGKRREALVIAAERETLLPVQATDSPARSAPTCLALALLQLGQHDRALDLYPSLLAFQGQYRWLLVDRVLGMLDTLKGDWIAAEAHLDSAEEIARRESLRPELARTVEAQADLVLAQSKSGSAARARDLLGQALGLFQELEMTGEIARVRDRLRTLPSQPVSVTRTLTPAGLSEREVSVLKLVAVGKSNRQIAAELFLSEKTVANHLTSIFNKMGVDNRAGATDFAHRHNLV